MSPKDPLGARDETGPSTISGFSLRRREAQRWARSPPGAPAAQWGDPTSPPLPSEPGSTQTRHSPTRRHHQGLQQHLHESITKGPWLWPWQVRLICIKILFKSAHSCIQLALTLYYNWQTPCRDSKIQRFIHSSFNNYLPSTCGVPSTCLGSSLISRDMASKLPVRREANTSTNLHNQNRREGGSRWYGERGWGWGKGKVFSIKCNYFCIIRYFIMYLKIQKPFFSPSIHAF